MTRTMRTAKAPKDTNLVHLDDDCGDSNFVAFHFFRRDHDESSADESGGCRRYCTDIGPEPFHALMDAIRQRLRRIAGAGAVATKQYKEYVYRDLVAQCSHTGELKVHKTSTARVVDLPDHGSSSSPLGILRATSTRTKLSIISFPSTNSIHHAVYVERTSFRVTHRLHVNFHRTYDPCTREVAYSVSLSYNHDRNVDLSKINEVVAQVLS
jgi:hypothetical protein